jgi:hypothetical protein
MKLVVGIIFATFVVGSANAQQGMTISGLLQQNYQVVGSNMVGYSYAIIFLQKGGSLYICRTRPPPGESIFSERIGSVATAVCTLIQ